MLNRRNARIKVMQLLYGYWQAQDIEINELQKNLNRQFDQSYDLYLFCLLQIREIAYYAYKDTEIKKSKHLPTAEDQKASPKIAESPIIQNLLENEDFNKQCKKRGLNQLIDIDITKRIFNELSATNSYKRYLGIIEGEQPDDQEILSVLFSTILVHDELFDNLLETNFPVWLDDEENVIKAVEKIIPVLYKNDFLQRNSRNNYMREIRQFADELILKTIQHRDEIEKLIDPKLDNWDIDRIALMDMLLMHMALTEILDFPTIPIKVTMNEYIDISKYYSTPKSKEFINGVLDKVMKGLKAENKIHKEGRGLIENS
jgi:transcription antitermination protein NusB